MLTIASHVPAIAAASRRALKAAALTIQLCGGRVEDCSIGSGGLPPTCIYHSSGRLLLVPTCADRPLLLAEIEELVRSVQEDALIVRLNTWPAAQHLVSFDVISRRHWDIEVATGLLPCTLDGIGGLWLVPPPDGRARLLVLDDEGLRPPLVPPPFSEGEIERGVEQASAVYRTSIWGGL